MSEGVLIINALRFRLGPEAIVRAMARATVRVDCS